MPSGFSIAVREEYNRVAEEMKTLKLGNGQTAAEFVRDFYREQEAVNPSEVTGPEQAQPAREVDPL